MSNAPTLRRARIGDAAELARLADELGYPMSRAEMVRRLETLLASDRHCVSVVESAPERLAGWVHVEHRSTIEGGDRAELMGLVVDARVRRSGVGKALVAEAERWAAARRLGSLTVRSNVVRDESHPFYAALGFVRSKTQHVYTKGLEPE